MRRGRYAVTFDRNFEGVIKACAGKREGHWQLTWITPRMMKAYAALYDVSRAGLLCSVIEPSWGCHKRRSGLLGKAIGSRA